MSYTSQIEFFFGATRELHNRMYSFDIEECECVCTERTSFVFQVQVERGKNGFGFTVVDEFPVKVGRVDLGKLWFSSLLWMTFFTMYDIHLQRFL